VSGGPPAGPFPVGAAISPYNQVKVHDWLKAQGILAG
jgi:hypothetical protein